jgi:hypothetical protein
MKTFIIPQYGITVMVDGAGVGAINSELKKHLIGDDPAPGDEIEGAVDALESLIMAHAVAGIDVASPAYVTGLETCMEALGNNL